MRNSIEKFPLYRYRFLIGFGLLAILTFLFAAWDFWRIPNGLTDGEMATASLSGQLNFREILHGSIDLINLPFLILQKLFIELFGFSTFALRLPSVILSLFAMEMLTLALTFYERRDAAMISVFLVATSPLFLSLARSGDAGSMTIFLGSAFILAAILLLSGRFRGWQSTTLRLIICLLAALLIYMPGGLIVIGLLIVLGLVHPKTRYEFFRNRRYKLLIGLVVALLVVSPLAIALARGHSSLATVGLGGWSLANFGSALKLFFVGDSLISGFLSPILNIAIIVLVIYGVARLAQSPSAARSLTMITMLAIALILTIGNTKLACLLLVPVAFALATGIAGLLRAWYGLFPVNPYARIFALPIVALLIGVIGFGSVGNYFSNNFYAHSVVSALNRQFEDTRSVILKRQKQILLVPGSQLPFYRNLTRDFPKLAVTGEMPNRFSVGSLIIVNDFSEKPHTAPIKITTDFVKENSILVREY